MPVPPSMLSTLAATIAHVTEASVHTLHDPAKRAEFVDTIVNCCEDAMNALAAVGRPTPHALSRRGRRSVVTVRDTSPDADRTSKKHATHRTGASSPLPRTDSICGRSLAGSLRVQVSDQLQKSVNADGDKMINDYAVVGSLGRGSMGKVKLAVHGETDQVVAIKVLNKSLLQRVMKGDGMTALTQVQQEVAIMKKLNHRNVVKMHEVIDDPEKDKMYIVMDYVPGGQLFELEPQTGACPAMPVDEIRGVMRQMCAGLMYLHRHGIVHRDIKPDNVLIDRETGCVFLSDFGVSEICGGSNGLVVPARMEGTPMYMAPEAFRVDATSGLDGESLDVWAWGVTLYCMLYGQHPFVARTIPEMCNRILNEDLEIPREATTPDAKAHPTLWNGLVDLVAAMLHRDPSRRAKVKGVRAALRAMKAPPADAAIAVERNECEDVQINLADLDLDIELQIEDIQHSITLKSCDLSKLSAIIPSPLPTPASHPLHRPKVPHAPLNGTEHAVFPRNHYGGPLSADRSCGASDSCSSSGTDGPLTSEFKDLERASCATMFRPEPLLDLDSVASEAPRRHPNEATMPLDWLDRGMSTLNSFDDVWDADAASLSAQTACSPRHHDDPTHDAAHHLGPAIEHSDYRYVRLLASALP